MQPQIMLALILDDHARRHRQAEAEAMAHLDRRLRSEAAKVSTGAGRRTPRPPLGPLARLLVWTRWPRRASARG